MSIYKQLFIVECYKNNRNDIKNILITAKDYIDAVKQFEKSEIYPAYRFIGVRECHDFMGTII